MSDASRWQHVKGLFQAALERPAEARPAFLDQACADSQLRQDVESLLASHAEVGSFLEVPAAPFAPVVPGSRLGPYEIVAPIGIGGMGEVYRGRDARLDRDVAVKVLPHDLAMDPDRQRRFAQEARAASALNHPNIVAVYDIGSQEGVGFIVTELLEGQPLAERVAQGPLTVRKALECAVQVARGLDAAHRRGIVHRDLKPANLFLTPQGQVKILDFGIAKLARATEGISQLDRGGASPTVPGLVLGTVGYMSPEQVRGDPVDARSDQFSLGCVLYELLAGQAPFRRPTDAQTMAAVLEAEPPPLAQINPRVPRPVAWIVERCLAKDPEDRYSATADLARDLELALSRLSELSAPLGAVGGHRSTIDLGRLALSGAVVAASASAAWFAARREPPAVPVVRYVTSSGRDSAPAAAPDGKTIAFTSSRDGRHRIWLKQLATGSEAPLTAGEDDYPRFSPDGSLVLFVRRQAGQFSLYRIPTVGGEPRKVVDDAMYGDFSPDGRRIAFVRQRVNETGITSLVCTAGADGSGVRELARLDSGTFVDSAFVRWSPDGRFLAATKSTQQLGPPNLIVLLDVRDGRARTLAPPNQAGVWRGGVTWAGPDEVLYSQPESTAGAQTTTSSRVALLHVPSGRTQLLFSSPANIPALDVLGPGRLLLETSSVRQNLREVPLRSSARPGNGWLTHGKGADRQPTYARDREWIAFSSNRTGNLDIWAVSRRSGAVRRLTDDAAHDSDPGFMPDGRLLWSSNRNGPFEIWMAEADGSGARQVSHDGVDAENPVATPDGRWIVYASTNPRTRGIVKIRPDGTEATLLVPGHNLIEPEVSPDGRYLAMVADAGSDRACLRVARMEDGSWLAFEAPVPRPGDRTYIDRGRSRWLPDGRGLVYIDKNVDGRYGVFTREFTPGAGPPRLVALEANLDAESLAVSPDGASLTVSFREELFDLMVAEGVSGLERARRGR